jgi:putative nucleotidyltransferase with HDIG domain
MKADLSPYAGRWIARVGDKIVGQGGLPQQALQAAKQSRYKEKPTVTYVPTANPLRFSPLLERVRTALPEGQPLYLVGGAVRDALLSKPSHDLDFASPGDALSLARRLANRLGGAYYPLDVARGTARVIAAAEDGQRYNLDFAALRGPTLQADLEDRDFTINAMAVEVRSPQALLDPLGGAADLDAKTLRACSPTSFEDDPVRILRAIRMAATLDLSITPETRAQMEAAVPVLPAVSPERLCLALFRILEGPRPAASIRALDMLGALAYVLPELETLKGVEQTSPHVHDAWEHTLSTVRSLEKLLAVLDPDFDPEVDANVFTAQVSLRLGRYRQQLGDYLERELVIDRSVRSLSFLATLYHDIGKPGSSQHEEESGRIRFLEHEHQGADVIVRRARQLRLSNAEVDWLETVVEEHMRPTWLAREEKGPSKRAVYRFFRDVGEAGVGVVLLSLADLLGTYENTLSRERWERQIEVARALLDAWWEQHNQRVDPPALISGHDLIETFDLRPSPLIGELLEAVREAQAVGQVRTRQEALAFVEAYLHEGGENTNR